MTARAAKKTFFLLQKKVNYLCFFNWETSQTSTDFEMWFTLVLIVLKIASSACKNPNKVQVRNRFPQRNELRKRFNQCFSFFEVKFRKASARRVAYANRGCFPTEVCTSKISNFQISFSNMQYIQFALARMGFVWVLSVFRRVYYLV